MTRRKNTKLKSIDRKKPNPPPPMNKPNNDSGGLFAGLMSTVAQGFAFGSGSAMAHKAVDTVLGGNKSETIPLETNNKDCYDLLQKYKSCLSSEFDTSICQQLSDDLDNCMRVSRRI